MRPPELTQEVEEMIETDLSFWKEEKNKDESGNSEEETFIAD